jgi:hypothetical protein
LEPAVFEMPRTKNMLTKSGVFLMSEEKNTNQDNNELSLEDLEAVAGGTDPGQKGHKAGEKLRNPAHHSHKNSPHPKQ